MSKQRERDARPPRPGKQGRGSRSPQAQAARRRRARRLRWSIGGALAVVVAGVITAVAVTSGGSSATAGRQSPGPAPSAGSAGWLAPDGSFTAVSGRTETISSLRGRKTLVWFVATWCPSCQAGTQAMAGGLARLRAAGIRVVELEDYADLGQPGPDIAALGRQFAGAAYRDPDWTFGLASKALTGAYDPQGYLDIYYLLDAAGHVRYTGSGPGSAIGQILTRAAGLT